MAKPLASKAVSGAAHRGHASTFLEIVSGISRREGWSDYETFVKWLEAAACIRAAQRRHKVYQRREVCRAIGKGEVALPYT